MSRTFAEMQQMYREVVERFSTIELKPWEAQGAMIELSKQQFFHYCNFSLSIF